MKFNVLLKIFMQKFMPAFSIIIRLSLGCIFIYSSLPKIRQPYDFLANVYNYEIVGPKLGMLIAMTLPWVELLVGIALVGGIFVGGALLVSIGLGAMFCFVVGWALYHGLDISCGCFSSSPDSGMISYMTLIRTIAIFLLSGIVYVITVFLQPNKEQLLG